MALTLDHLATLPKRDKDYSISSFVQEQQRFSKQYLYEGQRVVQSWNYSEPISPPAASPKNDPLLGFGTPVLRARLDLVSTRVSRPNGTGHNKTTRGQESSKENERPSGHGAKLPDTDKQKEGSQKKYFSKAGKKRSKEYHLRSNSDNESVQRQLTTFIRIISYLHSLILGRADRRQRKKTKRDIMDPESSGDSDNEAKPSDTCKNRKQTKRQSKLRQEFALMHGFSSTNVGKNRLTVSRETPFRFKPIDRYFSSILVFETLVFFRKVKLPGKPMSFNLENVKDKIQVNLLPVTMTSELTP